jgi:mRNA interferase MazF
MHRGEIWWAALPRPRGSEPGLRRPVLVIQSDPFNRSRISTVVVAAITSNLDLSDAPGNVRLPRRESRLPKDSVVNVSQILTVDRSCLTECVGAVPKRFIRKVEGGIRLVLGV